jgi:ABC-type transport system involved in cytochrome c biogenesis ATPase subunit
MTPNLIELRQVNKFLGNRCILKNANLIIPQSKILQVSGANGSGKSTLLRILADLLEVEVGTVWHSSNFKVAYQGHELGLYEDLTVSENLFFFQQLSSVSSLMSDAVEQWQLVDLLDLRVSSLSRGQAWRVALAISFSQQAQLVILDEPTANLDSSFASLLREQIREYRVKFPTSSFVIATHEDLQLPSEDSIFIELKSAELKVTSQQNSGA